MSQYTTSLRFHINLIDKCEHDNSTFGNFGAKIELGRKIFFPFDYGAHPDFKILFENEFLNHYFDSDVYCDDIDKFKHRLEIDVRAKIPQYSKLWELINSDISLLSNGDYIDTTEETTRENSSGTSKSAGTGKNKTLASNYPQDISLAGDFGSVKYMNSGSMGNSENETNSEAQNEARRDYERTFTHKETGALLEKINQLNFEKMNVIKNAVNSFSDLFMLLW